MWQCCFSLTLWFCIFVSVSGEGIAVVCVSRVSAGAPRGAEEDPQLSQHQQQSDKQACTVSIITKFMYVQQGCSKQLLSSFFINLLLYKFSIKNWLFRLRKNEKQAAPDICEA